MHRCFWIFSDKLDESSSENWQLLLLFCVCVCVFIMVAFVLFLFCLFELVCLFVKLMKNLSLLTCGQSSFLNFKEQCHSGDCAIQFSLTILHDEAAFMHQSGETPDPNPRDRSSGEFDTYEEYNKTFFPAIEWTSFVKIHTKVFSHYMITIFSLDFKFLHTCNLHCQTRRIFSTRTVSSSLFLIFVRSNIINNRLRGLLKRTPCNVT